MNDLLGVWMEVGLKGLNILNGIGGPEFCQSFTRQGTHYLGDIISLLGISIRERFGSSDISCGGVCCCTVTTRHCYNSLPY